MEYVQKAIEKARDKRQGKAGEEESATITETEQGGSESLSAEKFVDKDALSIDYTSTRKVELNKRILMDARIVAAFDDDLRAEPYRQLRTQVLHKFRENNWKTLAITSAEQNAGKTLTAINLAVALSKEVNQTVLLVDVDFKGPNIVDFLGIETRLGFMDWLNGNSHLREVLVNPGLDRLSILPAMPIQGPTSEILSSPGMKTALEDLVGRYSDRIIIFDLPPLLRDDDALVFTPYVDATLLVVEDGVTTPADLERCVQLLEGTNIVGTVLNKAA